MTQGRRRTKGEEKARKIYKEFLKRDMHDLEKRAFHSAFGMGWKQGKKRQRQITREELKLKK